MLRSGSWQLSRQVSRPSFCLHLANGSNQEEVESLSSLTNDSAKILTEKLALSREIALLKPEIEHLKTQLAHEKDVLAEKLAIERQLNELEVELANEKRAAEKAAQKQQGRDNEAEDELRQQVQDLEKQLAKERRAVQKVAEGQETRSAEVEEELRELREQLAEAEKKLVAEKRAAAKAAKSKTVDNTESTQELELLRLKLVETEEALASEKQDKERIRKEGEKAVAEAESLRLPLEERVDNLKVKLRETREELKSCRADLQRAQEATATVTMKVPTKKAAVAKGPTAKKRRANEISVHDSVLQTPNKDEDRPKRAAKKPFAPAAVGEKSTFSITPFLNKTINLSDASLKPITEDAEDEEEDEAETVEVPTTKSKAKKQPALSAKPKAQALSEASPSKHNMPVPLKSRKAPIAEITLENVIEEPEEGVAGQENRPLEAVPFVSGKADAAPKKKRMVLKSRTAAAGKVATVTAPAPVAEETPAAPPAVPEPKKKKRKLVGAQTSTLFEDAEDVPAPIAVAPVVAAGKRAPVGRANLAAGLAAKRAVGLGAGPAAGKGAFGAAFSPLKRDRRGVGASFLA